MAKRPDVVPGDYLRLKNLWNDPHSGRFIRKGRSSQKALSLVGPGAGGAVRLRVHAMGPQMVRVKDDRLSRSGIHRGDLVVASYRDETYADVSVTDPDGSSRHYKVKWERFDDSYVPESDGGKQPDVQAPAPLDSSDPAAMLGGWNVADTDPNRYQQLMDLASQPDATLGTVSERARQIYGSWDVEDIDTDPQKRVAFIEAAARAARDSAALRHQTGGDLRDVPPLPPEVLLLDPAPLADWAQAGTHSEAVSAWRLADTVMGFHTTPLLGTTTVPAELSAVSRQIAMMNPDQKVRYDDASGVKWDGDRVQAAVSTSPMLQKMIAFYGQPSVAVASMSTDGILGETQGDIAQLRPDEVRLVLMKSLWDDDSIHDAPQPLESVDTMEQNGRDDMTKDVVDLSFSGAVRHEYGHFMDMALQSAYHTFADDKSSKAKQRIKALELSSYVSDPSTGDRFPYPWLASFFSNYAGASPDEMMAEVWATISHPDYPKWKAQLVAKATGKPRDKAAVDVLRMLDAAETYFSPESTLLVPRGTA